MSPQKSIVMHGRDHREGGPDPIPGIGPGSSLDTSGFVVAQVPGLKKLWAGSHGATSSGASSKTTVACPLASSSGPAPVANKWYDHLITPVGASNNTLLTNGGVVVHPLVAGATINGVQFYRGSGGIAGAHVDLWTAAGTLLTGADNLASGVGWNEIYFATPYTMALGTDYIVSWYAGGTGLGGRFVMTTPRNWASSPLAVAGVCNSSLAPASARRALNTNPATAPTTGDTNEFAVGPIINYAPAAPQPLYVVATAAAGTAAGVYIVRCEVGAGVIDIYWSAANVTVAAHLVAVGADPGTSTAPIPMATYNALKATYATYGSLLTTYPTYAKILTG